MALEDDAYSHALRDFGSRIRRPEAILVVSAHWEAAPPIRVNEATRPSVIYDFGGFPPPLYRLTYPAPGAPALAAEVRDRLARAGLPAAAETVRGWDHGVWVPLLLLFPSADIPVVEISLPAPRRPEEILDMGKALASLRERGVLVFGSGGIVHNLGRVRFGEKEAPPEAWAVAFDDWIRDRVESRDVSSLLSYKAHAPHADLAVPTTEHFDPLFFVLGSRSPDDRVVPVYEGFHYGTLSMRSFTLEGVS